MLARNDVSQRVGTGAIGRLYGPVMVIWFVVLALAGIGSLVRGPHALVAISPSYAIAYVHAEPATAFVALGSVVLAVTGAEALYADLGHFGRAPIRQAWLLLVLPALVLAYLGEAGEVLRDPGAAKEPFYAVVPGWGTIPVLVIATINLALAIITEATLSFLGSGMPETMPSLGTLIRIGNNYLFSGEWWIVAFPGIALAVLVLAINLLGDWLRDALNPRLR